MLPVERYNQAEATMSTLLEMLLAHEHLAAPLAREDYQALASQAAEKHASGDAGKSYRPI